MKAKKPPTDVALFAEACRPRLIEVGGKTICPSHPRGQCRADVQSEARDGGAADRARVLVEHGADVRTLDPLGRAAIAPTRHEATETLAKYGLTPPPSTRPLPLVEAPFYQNARTRAEATTTAARTTPTAVQALLERLDRVAPAAARTAAHALVEARLAAAAPARGPVPAGLHERLAAAVRP